jgi:hypothetical protein
MSNLSGIGDNKTYRGSLPPREPYYYIRANLELAGQEANSTKLFYFNKENSFAYANTHKFAYPNPDAYPGYYLLDEHSVIGEVAVYDNPELASAANRTVASGSALVNISRSSGVATLTLNAPASSYGLASGDYVIISGLLNNSGSFNSATPVQISVSGNSFSYANGSGNYGGTVASGVQILSVARTGGTATVTLNAAASTFGLVTGDYVNVSGILNNSGGFNTSGAVLISVSGNTISYTNGTGNYGGVAASVGQITLVERNAGVATITLSAAASTFGLVTGDYVVISDLTNDGGSFNSVTPVQITVSGSTFTYTNGSGNFASEAAAGASRSISLGTAAGASRALRTNVAAGGSRAVATQPFVEIGGAYRPSFGANDLDLDVWGGSTGNTPGPIFLSDLENAQVCYYGSEPLNPGYDAIGGSRKFLAMKLRGGNGLLNSGNLSLVLKVYPKFR